MMQFLGWHKMHANAQEKAANMVSLRELTDCMNNCAIVLGMVWQAMEYLNIYEDNNIIRKVIC